MLGTHSTIFIGSSVKPLLVGPLDYERETSSRSCRTIIRTSSAKLTLGSQPSSASTLVGSASRSSTSAGRKYRGLTATRTTPEARSRPTSSTPSPSQLELDAGLVKRELAELAHRVVPHRFRQHSRRGWSGLQHQPHRLDEVAGKTPVTAGIEVTESHATPAGP